MVQRFIPAFGGGNSYLEVFFDTTLPNEIIKTPGTQAAVDRRVLGTGFSRYNASD